METFGGMVVIGLIIALGYCIYRLAHAIVDYRLWQFFIQPKKAFKRIQRKVRK